MKKRLIPVVILITIVLQMFLNFYKVEAFEGALAPEGYIHFSPPFSMEGSIATGTIGLDASIRNEYNISYQKIVLTEDQLNIINEKEQEINAYIIEKQDILHEKQANVEELEAELESLRNSETATEEQIAEAEEAYNAAFADYQEFINTEAAYTKVLEREYYDLIPNFTDSWVETTITENNVQLDFEGYSGRIHFVLWVKITNGTNTYYDMKIYAVTVEPEETVDEEWTDFSNAEFELKKDGISKANIEISNVTPKEESNYYLFITSNSSKPNVTGAQLQESISLTYDSEKEIFKTISYSEVAKYVELNQDLYVSILEVQPYGRENVVVFGKKLERYAEPKYSDAFFATFMSYDATQLITTFSHSEKNNRNIIIKVGKITDTLILQKIKNQDSSGFADLLAFAKSNDGIYNKKVAANKNYFRIAYEAGEMYDSENSVISLDGLKDEEYYFLYIEACDDDGNFISHEAVTLAQASVHEDNSWYLFFYGDEDFKWAEFSNAAPGILPDTGIGKCIMIISILAIIVIVSYIKVKNLKEIK